MAAKVRTEVPVTVYLDGERRVIGLASMFGDGDTMMVTIKNDDFKHFFGDDLLRGISIGFEAERVGNGKDNGNPGGGYSPRPGCTCNWCTSVLGAS